MVLCQATNITTSLFCLRCLHPPAHCHYQVSKTKLEALLLVALVSGHMMLGLRKKAEATRMTSYHMPLSLLGLARLMLQFNKIVCVLGMVEGVLKDLFRLDLEWSTYKLSQRNKQGETIDNELMECSSCMLLLIILFHVDALFLCLGFGM